MSAPPTSEAARRNPVPAGSGAPLPLQRQVFEQARRGQELVMEEARLST